VGAASTAFDAAVPLQLSVCVSEYACARVRSWMFLVMSVWWHVFTQVMYAAGEKTKFPVFNI
jgi:hypothetical protein